MRIIGIDPGLTGAVAVFSDLGESVPQIIIHDTPIFEKMKAGERTTYDVQSMWELLFRHDSVDIVVLEQLQAMPHNGSIANYSSGLGFGLWRMAIAAAGYPCTLVSAAKWKKAMGLTKSKDDSRQKAIELFPQMADQMKLKKHHGRAEALLLAEYGKRHL